MGATPARAHAALVASDPADRSALATAPDHVELRFNEPVDAVAGAVRVFDGEAERVDLGQRDTGDPASVAVDLPDGLPDDGYIVTYRVVSADSHVVAGVITFTVGDVEEVDDALVAELFGGTGGDLAGILGPALRGVGYLAATGAAGAVGFVLLVARRDADRTVARRLAVRAAWVGVAVTLLAVPVQGSAIAGVGLLEAIAPTVLREVLASSFGVGTVVRLAALLALVAAWRPSRAAGPSRPSGSWPLAGVAGLVVLGSYLLDGHQRSVEPAGVLLAGDALHLVAAATWFVGLVLLAAALRREAADPDPDGTAALVSRFSTVAAVSVLAATVGGLAMAAVLVRSPQALTSTGYGWTLLAKVAVVAGVLAIAAVNRFRLVPAVCGATDPARAVTLLRRTVGTEAGLLVVALLLTGALVAQQPAVVAAGLAGSYQTTVALTDELDVDLVIDPNRAGRNTLHVYVLDATGRPAADVEDLRLELTYLPRAIGPIPRELFQAGPGHWTGTIDDLAFAGAWQVRIVAAVGRFDEASTSLELQVGP